VLQVSPRRSDAASRRERQETEKKWRTDGNHCPVCVERLPRLGDRAADRCGFCGGHRVPERRCAKCQGETVWEGGAAAGCGACGHHGSKVRVFAGQDWLKRE
jgi:hypothetical protein